LPLKCGIAFLGALLLLANEGPQVIKLQLVDLQIAKH
jgi:hypothetical protein